MDKFTNVSALSRRLVRMTNMDYGDLYPQLIDDLEYVNAPYTLDLSDMKEKLEQRRSRSWHYL